MCFLYILHLFIEIETLSTGPIGSIFMEHLEDNDVAFRRTQFSSLLDMASQSAASLFPIVALESEADVWDLQLQAVKEAIERHSLTPEEFRSFAQHMQAHMATAEDEFVKHIAFYSLQSRIAENLPRILELGRLAICGHRVCWHVEHVLRNLSEPSLTAFNEVILFLPDNRQSNEFINLAHVRIEEPLRYIVNRGNHFRSFDFDHRTTSAKYCAHLEQPNVTLENMIRYRYLRLPNGLKVLLSSDPTAEKVNSIFSLSSS